MDGPNQTLQDWVIRSHEDRMAKVEADPRFSRLIREVAIAEQSRMHGLTWLQRNSRTYGIWATRGMDFRTTKDLKRRARLLADEIAIDLWGEEERYSGERRERAALAYVTALDYVRVRQITPIKRAER